MYWLVLWSMVSTEKRKLFWINLLINNVTDKAENKIHDMLSSQGFYIDLLTRTGYDGLAKDLKCTFVKIPSAPEVICIEQKGKGNNIIV